MMPAALIYALSDERQRAALNRAHAARTAARAAATDERVASRRTTPARPSIRRVLGTRVWTS
jgi:hypothetical protein